MREIEGLIEQLLDWNDQTESPTLTEIEEAIVPLGRQVQEKMAQQIIQSQPQQSWDVACPRCGESLRYKDVKATQVQSSLGSLRLERAHYYCPACREGFFPPRRSTGSDGWLE